MAATRQLSRVLAGLMVVDGAAAIGEPRLASQRRRPTHLEPVRRLMPAAWAARVIVQPDRAHDRRAVADPSGVRRALGP